MVPLGIRYLECHFRSDNRVPQPRKYLSNKFQRIIIIIVKFYEARCILSTVNTRYLAAIFVVIRVQLSQESPNNKIRLIFIDI